MTHFEFFHRYSHYQDAHSKICKTPIFAYALFSGVGRHKMMSGKQVYVYQYGQLSTALLFGLGLVTCCHTLTTTCHCRKGKVNYG